MIETPFPATQNQKGGKKEEKQEGLLIIPQDLTPTHHKGDHNHVYELIQQTKAKGYPKPKEACKKM